LSKLNRRTFMQLSGGAVTSGALVLAASRKAMAQTAAPKWTSKDGKTRVQMAAYAWEYTQSDDSFRLLDEKGRAIVSGRMQPSIVVAPSGDPSRRLCTQGKTLAPRVEDGKVLLSYEGVNGAARVSLHWRFDDYGAWLDPIEYDSPSEDDVVSVHYFTYVDGMKHSPTLSASYLVVPGISEGDAVSPILFQTTQLNESVWLGRGSFTPGLFQQWGLPVHYFSGFSVAQSIPYGSSGYDWASSPSIWFDSAASGSIGSLNDFVSDEEGEGATPELIARYNGVAKVLRPTSMFEVLALGEVSLGATRGAHARSWARLEGGQLVLMAYRPDPAGEPNALASRSKDARIQEAVSALAPVIVSSKTPEGIAHSMQLAVVAYGDGPVVVRRDSGSRAEVVSHYLGGEAAKKVYSIRDGKLILTAAQRDAVGRPLQWMDVVIS
jgi:hypothetical protein